jgi:hypothetical protein
MSGYAMHGREPAWSRTLTEPRQTRGRIPMPSVALYPPADATPPWQQPAPPEAEPASKPLRREKPQKAPAVRIAIGMLEAGIGFGLIGAGVGYLCYQEQVLIAGSAIVGGLVGVLLVGLLGWLRFGVFKRQ